jgi:hypothetical protein
MTAAALPGRIAAAISSTSARSTRPDEAASQTYPALIAQAAHFTCTFALQRLALRTKAWFPVITSTLASNAISLIMPGGAAVGAAVQFRMLATSGEHPRKPAWPGPRRQASRWAGGWPGPARRQNRAA